MTQDSTVYEEISTRIKTKFITLMGLISDIDDTVSRLYNENALIDDKDERIANKSAIDLHNDMLKSQKQTAELVIEISKDCLELHKRMEKKVSGLEQSVKPLVKGKNTAVNLRDFLKWISGFAFFGVVVAFIVKHIKIV